MPTHEITTEAQLHALYGAVGEASLRKEVDHIPPVYRALIEASPFAVLATARTHRLDASPRGDPPGFVVVEDEKILLLPERRGNNRVDSLRNVLVDPRVALLFLVPGVGETLRVNGRARISVDPALLARFTVNGAPPKCVLVIHVEAAYFQCARAIHRANLWHAAQPLPGSVPSAGTMLQALTQDGIDGAAYDQALPQRQRETLY